MLALQEAVEPAAIAMASAAARDRRARERGRDLLRALARLQAGLLGASGADVAALRQLAALADDVPEAADPELGAILAQIALRARVEAARYEIEHSS